VFFFPHLFDIENLAIKKEVECTLEKTQKIPILFPISWSKKGEISSPEKKKKKTLRVVNPSV
jgi:hypothetical protein